MEASSASVGVGVIVVRGDKVLFGLRRGAYGGDTWSFPGGHVDDGESAEARALRELEEETGLRAVNPCRVAESEDVFPDGLRYRTIFVRVDSVGGELAAREPEACACWSWFRWDDRRLQLGHGSQFPTAATRLSSAARLKALTFPTAPFG